MHAIDSADGEQGDFEIEVHHPLDDHPSGASAAALLRIAPGASLSWSAERIKLWPLPEELITGLTMHGKPISVTAARKPSSLSAKR